VYNDPFATKLKIQRTLQLIWENQFGLTTKVELLKEKVKGKIIPQFQYNTVKDW